MSYQDVYALKPVNPHVICFAPISLEQVLYLSTQFTSTRAEYNNLNTHISASITGTYSDGWSQNTIFPVQFTVRSNLTPVNLVSYRMDPGVTVGQSYIPFGPFIRGIQLASAGAGGPDIIPKEFLDKEKSGLIGIIASKCTVNAGAA